MTITEAKKHWRVSSDKICEWLEKGIVPEVEIIEGAVFIRELKPVIPQKNAVITVESVRKYILRACNELGYIDYRILGIKQEQFRDILLQLENNQLIQRSNSKADCFSNRNFTITDQGIAFLNKGKIKLEELDFKFKFKYLEVYAKFEGSN